MLIPQRFQRPHEHHYLTDAYLTDQHTKANTGIMNSIFRTKHLIAGRTAKEQMLYHIAMRYRIMVFIGGHGTSGNIFAYSILGSRKQNDLSFCDYIEQVHTRIMCGDEEYSSMLQSDHKEPKADSASEAVV